VAPKRRLTLLDCVGLGINGIIGTGIFLLPARVFAAAGGFSWAAWLAIGGVCLLVGFSMAEAAGMTERNGGPYVYAREAFGSWVGTAVGWMAFAATVFAYGAVARGFGRNLSYLVPALGSEGPRIALAIAVIFGLAALNYRGVKPGALTSDFFSGAKLIPILFFVAVGLFFVDWNRLSIPPPSGHLNALKLGGFAALFACTGFEYIPVPAGETENPRRAVPLALVGALGGSILLYVLVQIVFMGTHPSPLTADKPLAEAAGAFAGAWAGRFVAAGSVISAFGYLTGVALVAPRYLSALGEDGSLPPLLARVHPRFGTPFVSIAVTAALSAGFAMFADFDRLADLNNAAVFAQYVPSCLAVIVLRRTRPLAHRAFKVPLWVPVLATAGCLLFLNGIGRDDAIFSVATLLLGLLLHGLWRLLRPTPELGTR
jgi:amino acid transporter